MNYNKRPGSVLLSHEKLTLSLALKGFTTEFGMGSGGSPSLWPPSTKLLKRRNLGIQHNRLYLAYICPYLLIFCLRRGAKGSSDRSVRLVHDWHEIPEGNKA